MSNAYYRIYLNQVFELTKTLVIKSEAIADAINDDLRLYGHSIPLNPKHWKYYRNLAGEYHSTDVPMEIVSLDTLETIPFTKENLRLYRATRDAYRYGTRYYTELVNRYPTQERLILGIINPIDKDVAVNANDGEVLYYDPILIEPQEITLVRDLERWIAAYLRRWSVQAYALSDEYYVAAQWGVMFTQLPMAIMNLRQARVHTNEVHSYHMREYLASHQRFDVHLPYLTLEQSLFLYRNLKYLRNNAGKHQTFTTLVERIITARDLPLSRYDMLHGTDEMTQTLKPEIEMRRLPLNTHPGDGSSNRRTVADVMERQYSKARSNAQVNPEQLGTTVEDMENAQINRLTTKVLESALLDTTDSVIYPKEDIFFNHWIYLALTDRFLATITITNPQSGVSQQVSVKEAFYIFLFAYNAARGWVLTELPEVTAHRVQYPNRPLVTEVVSLTTTDRVTLDHLVKVYDEMPSMGVYITVQDYRDYAESVFVAANNQHKYYSQIEDHRGRAMLESVANACYHSPTLEPQAINYNTWFSDRGLDLSELTPLDLDLMTKEILNTIVGKEVASNRFLAELQRNMLEIMEKLSSYTVHYLQSINSTSYQIVGNVSSRLSDTKFKTKTDRALDIHRILPIRDRWTQKTILDFNATAVEFLSLRSSVGTASDRIGVGIEHDARGSGLILKDKVMLGHIDHRDAL